MRDTGMISRCVVWGIEEVLTPPHRPMAPPESQRRRRAPRHGKLVGAVVVRCRREVAVLVLGGGLVDGAGLDFGQPQGRGVVVGERRLRVRSHGGAVKVLIAPTLIRWCAVWGAGPWAEA